MTDTSQLKQEADYHEQPDLQCCENCQHGRFYYGNLECSNMHDCSVEPTAICKHYSQWWKKPEAHK
jgi:hypothetical protein